MHTGIIDSDRNMPDVVRAQLPPTGSRSMSDLPDDAGVRALDVADRVLAVREQRFWILPHLEQARAAVDERRAWIYRENPEQPNTHT